MEQRIVCIECGTKNRYEFKDSWKDTMSARNF
ncbi:hypothetical protein C810_04251 [Lachnospiraceae bacterium A2]|jgi:hypothetical protein|nr:hypothetical protein C810_04251 [Lachnospiraceae bacterium A2]